MSVSASFRIFCAWFALTLLFASHAAADNKPQRIVSLNLCTDQLLLDLVPRERISALSYLATDTTLSAKVAEAQGIPGVRGEAEEILAFDPDLIIAGEYTTPATVSLLQRLGRNVLVVPLPYDFQTMRSGITQIASAVGEEDRGKNLLQTFDARLAAIKPEEGQRLTALAYQVNSLASGPGSLVDAALEAAGFENLARNIARGPAGRVPLETLVLNPPDLIVMANAPDDFATVIGDNLRHPAFRQLLSEKPNIHLPMPLWMCATPKIADAVERLNEKRSEMLQKR
jgi:iron complex transport system substrate-binding protein